MKTNELMPGDWVTVTEDNNEFVGKVQAINAFSNYCIVKVGGDWHGSEHDVFIEDMQPVPLTQDILTKNGFAHKHNYNEGWLSIEEYPHWSVDIKADETPYRLIADNSTGVADIHDGIFVNKRINHVHELQHALRLCNIEKEIII